MNRFLVSRVLPPVLVLMSAALAFGYSSIPPSSRTGAPTIGAIASESTCRNCHGGNALNSGGDITLVSPPASYVPGNSYTLTVRLASSGTAANSGRRWGFQITAVKQSDGTGAGTLSNVAGQGTTLATGSGSYATRQYVEHDTGTHTGSSSPVTWQVQWTAPNPGVGDVGFYFSGVAGNGSGSSNDWVYTGSQVVPDATTPTLRTSWGQIKSRYR